MLRKTLTGLVACLALVASSSIAHATGLQAINTDVGVSIDSIDYQLEVEGPYVSATMEVAFRATTGETNAANMRFPLPPGAVIHKAEIYLPAQERWEAAETLGRRHGEAVYEDIVTPEPPEDPLLIQEIGQDFYRARIYPINAAGELRMKIHYAHILEPFQDGYALRVAFANPDSTPSVAARGVKVTVVTGAGTMREARWGDTGEDAGQASFDASLGRGSVLLDDFEMDKDLVLDVVPALPLGEATALVYVPEHDALEPHVTARWTPELATHIGAEEPRNVVFVIDTSGSMAGRKMDETIRAVGRLLDELGPRDRFGIVTFSTEVGYFEDEMVGVEKLGTAGSFVGRLASGGGTNMAGGLQRALEIGAVGGHQGSPVDLLLVTDGNPSTGALTANAMLAELGVISERLDKDVRVFACGIGHDLDQSLLNQLAQRTSGEATFALDDSEITGTLRSLFDRTRSGGLASVDVDFVGAGMRADDPFSWRRVFDGSALDLAGKGELDTTSLRMTGWTPLDQHLVLSADLKTYGGRSHTFDRIAAPLAAKAWSDRLNRRIDEQGETDARVQEAVELAIRYGIVTRYSSLLALESDEMYQENGVERVERDEAGIATSAITLSSFDEGRIGGAGTNDGGAGSSDNAWGNSEASDGGCSTTPHAPTTPFGALLVLMLVLGTIGVRRRG